MKLSKIGWCDYSAGDLNFVTGCTPVSTGCANCYGKALYNRFGKDFSEVTCHACKLDCLRRKKFPKYSPKRGEPYRPMAFVVDMGDLFHKNVPADFITLAFEIMEARKDVIWQVLTKRPERMNSVLFGAEGNHFLGGGDYIPNVWLGVSVENEETAAQRIPELVKDWKGTKFLSIEPMLEPIDLRAFLLEYRETEFVEYMSYEMAMDAGNTALAGTPSGLQSVGIWGPNGAIQWVIVGAESGPRRRPFDPAWAEQIREQCKAAGVAFFGKQDSALYPGAPLLIDGKTVHEWPESEEA